MVDCLSSAVTILLRPMHGWAELRQRPGSPRWTAVVFLLLLGPIPAVCRALGHLSMGWPVLGAVLDACWYSTICLMLLLLAGQCLAWLGPRFGAERDPAAALRVVFYSSTPFWISGLLFLVPSVLVHTLTPFLGLLAMGHLFYLGLQQVLAVGPARAIPLATLIIAGLTFLLVALTQVLPLPLLS